MTENIVHSPIPAMVISGFRQENGLVYIELPQGKYKVGEEIATFTGYNKNEALIDIENVENVFNVKEEQVLSHYENIDTKEIKTYKEFLIEKQSLDVRKEDPHGDEDMWAWPSIQARHAYELFMALWVPVYESRVTYSKVQVNVTGNPPIVNNPFITSMRKIGGRLDNTLYEYRVGGHINSVIREELEKRGYTALDAKPSIGGIPRGLSKRFWFEPGLVFSKIITPDGQDHYLTIHISDLKPYEKRKIYTGTFQECEAVYKNIEREIRQIMGVFFAKTTPLTDLDGVTIGEIAGDLGKLYNTLLKVESMKKTQGQYRESLRIIESIRKEFMKAVNA